MTHPIIFAHLPNFQRHRHIVENRSVRQQCKILEYHPDSAVSKLLQLRGFQSHHIGSFDLDLPCGWFQQAIEMAHKG